MRIPSLAFRALFLIGLFGLSINGCVFRTVAEQQKKIDALCQLWGNVSSEPAGTAPMVVILARHMGGDPSTPASWSIFDHFVLEGPGRWFFGVSPGTYALAAFEDKNGDLVYQPGESALRVETDRIFQCQAGEIRRDISLVIPAGGKPRLEGPIDIRAVQARTIRDQMRVSLDALMAAGLLIQLDDPRFSQENADKGLWRPFDFLFDAGAGVYFLDAYDAKKTPVLFVHGISGTPRDFEFLIRNLDRSKFQPWVFYYPSGAHLDHIADFLSQTVTKLQARLAFRQLFVVAHSMGGLVSRAFILKHQAGAGNAEIPLFVSISSPWGGHAAAESGVKHAPTVVRSWYDMAPNSPFLDSIFFAGADGNRVRRPLPKSVTHHLLFGFHRSGWVSDESGDGVITLASQLRSEAQDDAYALRGFDASHTGILSVPQVSSLLNRILSDAQSQ